MKLTRLSQIVTRSLKITAAAAFSAGIAAALVVGGVGGDITARTDAAAVYGSNANNAITYRLSQMAAAGVDPATIETYRQLLISQGVYAPAPTPTGTIPGMHVPGTLWSR